MNVSIFVPSIGRMSGGPWVMYEYANHLSRLGHEVHVGHMFFTPEPKQPLIENANWFTFDEGLHHHCVSFAAYAESLGGLGLGSWDSDIALGLDDAAMGYGLPASVVQGPTFALEVLGLDKVEGPVLCVSKNLAAECIDSGVAPQRVVHVPNGIDHEVFFPHFPIVGRSPRVSALYSQVGFKNSRLAVDVLRRVRKQVPDLEVAMFGLEQRPDWLPDWFDYVAGADHPTLARDVHSASSAYLCTSDFEGFGLPSLEAMACGAALVTTDTRGSRDYADHGETALVCDPGDAEALVANLVRVLRNDGLRTQLASAGMARAAEFDWSRTAETIEATFEDYLERPQHYMRGGGAR